MSKSLGDKSLTAVVWVIIDKLVGSSLNFVVTIILARLLTPEDFGLVAMVMVFFVVSAAFVESGFSSALIREKTITDIDKSTTFIFNLVVSLIIYAGLFFAAPAIAAFFKQPELVWIVRVMGLNLIINALTIIQRATLTQQIDFKTQTKIRLVAVFISGAVGIAMAFTGFGVWSLVAKIGVMALINMVLLWVVNPWRGRLQFSVESFRRLFNFGYKILLAGLIDRIYQQIYQLLIGRFFSAATLGYYSQAHNFSNMTINTLFRSIERVIYPVLARLNDDRGQLKKGYRQIVKLSSFFILPVLVMLGILAEPVLVTFVGEKWLPSVFFLQLLCISGATYHFSWINLNMLMVLGRTDLGLKLEVIKKVNITVAILVGLQFGIYGLVIGEVVAAYVNLLFNTYYSKKFLDYAFVDQLKDVLSTIAFSLFTGVVLFFMQVIPHESKLLQMLLGGLVGISLYGALHYFMDTEELKMLRAIIIPKTRQFIMKKA